MSRLVYNNVELSYIRTQAIDFIPKYDDTNTDYLWTEVSISVEALMSGTALPALGGESPTQTMVRVRSQLESPRKRLQFFVGNDTLIDTGGTGRDVQNGPVPQPCTITQIGGSATFLVSFKILTYIVECTAGGVAPDYQSHRWKETVSIDEDFYTKKTRSGKIYTRSDINANADSLRGLVIPAIDNGFKPISLEVTLQEDGLALMYSWVEQEIYLQPPGPATKAEGEYIESTSSPHGGIRFSECRVKLSGHKSADKGALLLQAILIATTAVSPDQPMSTAGNLNAGPMLTAAAVRTSLYENKVEVNIKAQITSTPARKQGVPMDVKRFTFIPKGSEPGTLPPDPGIRGTAGLALFAATFSDPCLTESILLNTGLGATRQLNTSGIPEVRVLTTQQLPDDNRALYSTSQLPGFLTNAQIHCEYQVKTWNVQLPVASANSASALVTLASPTGQKIVDWSTEKVGGAPKVPDPNVSDSNLVLLNYSMRPEVTVANSDGTVLTYKRSGRYVYAIQDVSQCVVDAGLPEFIDPSVRQLSVVQLADLAHGLIDGGTGDHVLSTTPGQIPPALQGQ
jgi:hypothetical protein